LAFFGNLCSLKNKGRGATAAMKREEEGDNGTNVELNNTRTITMNERIFRIKRLKQICKNKYCLKLK